MSETASKTFYRGFTIYHDDTGWYIRVGKNGSKKENFQSEEDAKEYVDDYLEEYEV